MDRVNNLILKLRMEQVIPPTKILGQTTLNSGTHQLTPTSPPVTPAPTQPPVIQSPTVKLQIPPQLKIPPLKNNK